MPADNAYRLRVPQEAPTSGVRRFIFDARTGTVWVGEEHEASHRQLVDRLGFDDHLPEVWENLVGGKIEFAGGEVAAGGWKIGSEYTGSREAAAAAGRAMKALFS